MAKQAGTSIWASASALEAAVKSGGDGLTDTFDAADEAHQAALLALAPGVLVSLLAMLGGPAGLRRRFPNAVAVLAQTWAMGGRVKDALTLCDALVEVDHQEFGAYGVALWAVQDDNNHLGIDEERARRYVARATPYGKQLADIHFNAMFVLLELGDHDAALAQLKSAMAGGFSKDVARSQLATEKLCEPVRDDARFKAAVA
jgi:hypothetical protein